MGVPDPAGGDHVVGCREISGEAPIENRPAAQRCSQRTRRLRDRRLRASRPSAFHRRHVCRPPLLPPRDRCELMRGVLMSTASTFGSAIQFECIGYTGERRGLTRSINDAAAPGTGSATATRRVPGMRSATDSPWKRPDPSGADETDCNRGRHGGSVRSENEELDRSSGASKSAGCGRASTFACIFCWNDLVC